MSNLGYKIWPLRLGFLILAAGILVLGHSPQPAGAAQFFQTQRAVIQYENPNELQEMARRLPCQPSDNFHQKYSYTQDPVQAALSPDLTAKVDGLLAKICLILNRRPRGAEPLHIVLLKDGRQVRQRYLALLPVAPQPSIFGYGSMEAFYEPAARAIFLSLADLREGILAHEMAHFLLCESAAPPSAELQEDWAHYVERSLN